jgi:pyruvate/2-oxoglutarate dehydrogenase complex dihydrolipoamide dehydrogenase (E3) component
MSRRFDAIVIGAGQAGPPLAERLSDAGMTVALIERHLFGGTCVNTGCMPTKTLVASAYAAHMARRAADFGVRIAGPVGIDFARVKQRADTVARTARTNVEAYVRGLAHCTVFTGQARFEGPKDIRVGEELLAADRIFINVGGRAVLPDMPGVHDIHTLNNTSMLALEAVPEHLVVIGGSYIGLEFAQMYRRFGAEVTVVEKAPRLIAREDEEVSDAVRDMLEREGIAIRLAAECISFAHRDNGILVGVDCTSGDREVLGSAVLLAVGRTPNTHDLGLDSAGVAMDARGYIMVDDRLETNVPGIWALGDCNGRGAFTHTAYNDYEIVADNLLKGANRRVSDRIATYALFVDPPLGRVGMTEKEAVATGRPILVGRRPMTRVGRAVERDETLGLMKIVVAGDTQEILGAAILGVGGDEAVHSVLDMMAAGGSVTALEHTMHIHPTVAELIPTIAGKLAPSDLPS